MNYSINLPWREPLTARAAKATYHAVDGDPQTARAAAETTADEAGKSLGRVKVGDTKLQALQRLSPRQGILVNKDDLGLLDSDTVSIERGPCVLKINAESGVDLVFFFFCC